MDVVLCLSRMLILFSLMVNDNPTGGEMKEKTQQGLYNAIHETNSSQVATTKVKDNFTVRRASDRGDYEGLGYL